MIIEGGAPASEVAAVEAAPVESNIVPASAQGNSAQVEQIEQAVADGELSPKEAQSLIKKYSLKVRGQTVEREYDLSNDDFMRDQFQLAEVSKQSMQQSAELKKLYEREMTRLKEDPFSVLAELGLDPEELSAGFISKKIEEMKKSPEQVEKEKYMKELETAKAALKKLEQEKEDTENAKLNQTAVVQLNEEIDKALMGHKSLPNKPLVRKRIADEMLWAMKNGFEDVTAEDVLPIVHKQMKAELNELHDNISEDALEDFVGRKNLDRAKKKRIEALTKVPENLSAIKPTSKGIAPKEAKPAERIKAKDFFRGR